MPKRLTDDQRIAILDDITAGMSAGSTATKHGVAKSTVSTLAKNNGISLDRSLTKKATEAAQADHQAVLAALAGRAARIGGNILASFESMDQASWSKVSPHTRAIAFGILADKSRELAPADDELRLAAGKSLAAAILEGFIERHGE